MEISTLSPVLIDCRDKQVSFQLNLVSVIAVFQGFVFTITGEGQACGKVVVADGKRLTIEVLR